MAYVGYDESPQEGPVAEREVEATYFLNALESEIENLRLDLIELKRRIAWISELEMDQAIEEAGVSRVPSSELTNNLASRLDTVCRMRDMVHDMLRRLTV